MGKMARWMDLLAAVFLLFLFPAVSIHATVRDRLFDACAERVRAYGEMLQKQGFLSLDGMEQLLCREDGILGEAELALWEEKVSGERIMLTEAYIKEHALDYMGAAVYPFSDAGGILFVLRMPADGLEKAYYYFCGEMPAREYMCFFTVRDGLCERQKTQAEEK